MDGNNTQTTDPQVTTTGRPSSFTPELGDEICARLAEGKSLRSILKADDMPAMSTVFRWLREDDEEKSTFREQYARAKQEAADALADEIQEVSDGVLEKKYDPNAARVAIDGKKWVASKLKPKVYGDRLDVTSGNEKINRGISDAELDAILKRGEQGKRVAQ